MSPTEDDLRAALHGGEGAGPDPDAVLAAARTASVRRRTRLRAAGGAAVLVLALAGGATVLATRGGGHSTTTGSPAHAAGPYPQSSDGAAAVCPARFTQASPGATLATTGDLLPAGTRRVLVCSYSSIDPGVSAAPSTTFTGSDATRLVESLNGAATTRIHTMCPDYRLADPQRLMLIGYGADGTASAPVSTVLGGPACSVVVSSATSSRFGWNPPPDLLVRIRSLHR